MTAKDKTKKLISALLVVSIISPAVLFSTSPKQAQAQAGSTAAISVPVADIPQEQASWLSYALHGTNTSSTITDTGLHVKDFAIEIGKQLLKVAAKRLLAQMTQATINWINSGFHGSPLFLENPESFFKDIAKSEIRNLVDMIGYDTFRFPFGKETALNVIDSYKRQFSTNAEYTLSRVINDPDLLVRYRNDFNYGGWNGFLINTQYPQNNYLGFNMIVQENLASRLEGTLQAPAQKVQSLLQQGMGFLSPQTCPDNPKYNNGVNEFLRPSFNESRYDKEHPFDPSTGPSGSLQWSQAKARARADWAEANTCPGGLVSTTPGSVAANQVFSAINVPFLTTALDGALGNSLAAIFDALINKLMSDGLTALAGTINPGPSEDNWSYDGNTLSSSTTTVEAQVLNIPQNVSVRVGETTSIAISGGSGNFSIKTPPDITKARAVINSSGSSGSKLTITGIAPTTPSGAPRTTAVVIEDAFIGTIEPVTVNITVNAIGALAVSPANIKTDTNTSNSVVAIISGGADPYSIVTGPDEGVAMAVLSGTNLIVIGIGRGKTFAVLKDASKPIPKTIKVDIEIINTEDLSIPQNISVPAGQTISVLISGGKEPYFIESVLGASATAVISKVSSNIQFLAITGVVAGASGVIIKDSSSQTKRASASILTTSGAGSNLNADPLGDCVIRVRGRFSGDSGTFVTTQKNMTKFQCESVPNQQGTWKSY